jgi:hypothetical protein
MVNNNQKGICAMKTLLSIFTVLLTVIILSSYSLAQESNYYTVTTWKISIPSGSDEELNKIMKEFYDKVASQNGIVVNEQVLKGSSKSDMRDWVFITEYTNRNSIQTTSDIKNTFVDLNWLSKEEREKYRDTFWEYAEIYSDDIFTELPGLKR